MIEGDTAEQFGQVVTPFLLPNGSLVVPDRGRSVIREFAPDGSYSRGLGAPGEGPGEFEGLAAAWNRGDTIEAWDGRQQRLTRFLPGGRVETLELSSRPGPMFALPAPLGAGWAFSTTEQNAPMTVAQRFRESIYRYLGSGEYAGALGSVESISFFFSANLGSPTPLSANRLLAIQNDRIYLGEGTTPRISVLDSLGDTLQVITWTPDPSPPVEEVLAQVIDSAEATTWDSGIQSRLTKMPGGIRGFYEAAPIPERVPIAAGVIVDAEGFVWIRPYEPLRHAEALGGSLTGPGPGGTWIIISPEGRRVGTVTVPDDLEPVQITKDAVVGIRRDELGVQYVRVYPVERR